MLLIYLFVGNRPKADIGKFGINRPSREHESKCVDEIVAKVCAKNMRFKLTISKYRVAPGE